MEKIINTFIMKHVVLKMKFSLSKVSLLIMLFIVLLKINSLAQVIGLNYPYNISVGTDQVCSNQSIYHLTLADQNLCSNVLFSTVPTSGAPANNFLIFQNFSVGVYVEFSVDIPEAVNSFEIVPNLNCMPECFLKINWNPSFIGKVKLRKQEFNYILNCNCRGLASTPIIDIYSYCVNVCGNAGISMAPNDNEIIGSGSRTFSITPSKGNVQWYAKTPHTNGVFELLVGQTGYDYTANYTEPGVYEYYATQNITDCGTRNSVTQQVVVKPTCVLSSVNGINNTTSIIASNSEGPNAVLTGAGVNSVFNNGYSNITLNTNTGTFESNGGYKVLKNAQFHLNLKGVVDFAQHYDVQFNASSDISPNTFSNNSSYTITSTIGSYRFSFVKKNDGVDRAECPNIPELKVFVGGSDVILPSSRCHIYLPSYFCQIVPPIPGIVNCNNNIIFQNFSWTIISQTGITIEPGMILSEGADLKIQEVELPIDKTLTDNTINWTELSTYDDYGNVVGSTRSYFDKQGRPLQSQLKNISSGVLIASQSLYDQYGRASLVTLPAPVSGLLPAIDINGCTLTPSDRIAFEYKNNFIRKASGSSGSDYSYKNFDEVFDPTKEYNPDLLQINTPGTLGWYYSDNNIVSSTSSLKEPFVAKTDYPFAKTVYYNDATQEIKHVVPAGNIYRGLTSSQNVVTSKVEAVLSTDPDVLKWLQMRAEFNTVNPTSLVQNAVKNKYTDQDDVVTYTISDKSGHTIISVHLSVDINTQIVTKTYSFNYYDDKGRLKYMITPNGVEAFFKAPPNKVPFNLIDKTSYEYNHQGWLMAIVEPDAGRTEYKYRRDGVLRFSQNALQRMANPVRYSYTNYDWANRPIESGEYTVNTGGTAWSAITSSMLENRTNGGLIGGLYSEVIRTYYDGENDINSPYAQEFVMGKVSCTNKVGETRSWYSYDERGRVVWKAQNIPVLGVKKIEYKYDPSGGVKEVAYQRGVLGEEFYHVYEYDDDTRLKKVYTSTVAPIYTNGLITNGIEQSEYSYYLHGPLKRVDLAQNLQGLDYLYTIEGWLKSINNHNKANDPGVDGNDVFGMSLEYYTGDYVKSGVNTTSLSGTGAADMFNGNIKASGWFTQKPAFVIGITNDPVGYSYTYDDKYQLQNAVFGNVTGNAFTASGNSFREGGLSYDLNGNIKQLQRYNSTANPLHNFQYNYPSNKNQLTAVFNSVTSDNYATYQYDAIGQLKSQTNGTMTSFAHHDVRGKMTAVSKDDIGTENIVRNYYDDNGLRYKKETFGPIDYTLTTTTWYVHDASKNVLEVYEQDNTISTSQPELIETAIYGLDRIGIVFNKTNSYNYELKDHLGNVRAIVRRNGSNQLEVNAYTDFYPYGMELRQAYSSNKYRYGYQGQFAEKDQETGWNAFELRMYDSKIGRWLSIDPYRQHWSPYLAMGNNPITRVDPDGGCDEIPCSGAANSTNTYVSDENYTPTNVILLESGFGIGNLPQGTTITGNSTESSRGGSGSSWGNNKYVQDYGYRFYGSGGGEGWTAPEGKHIIGWVDDPAGVMNFVTSARNWLKIADKAKLIKEIASEYWEGIDKAANVGKKAISPLLQPGVIQKDTLPDGRFNTIRTIDKNNDTTFTMYRVFK